MTDTFKSNSYEKKSKTFKTLPLLEIYLKKLLLDKQLL